MLISSPDGVWVELQPLLASPLGSELLGVIGLTACLPMLKALERSGVGPSVGVI